MNPENAREIPNLRQRRRMKTSIAATACVFVWCAGAFAATPGSAGPAGHTPPAVGTPLRDAAVCAGPDGTYYLTGAIATALPDEKDASYDNCRGVRVWKSKDLEQWEDLGLVWDLWKDPSNEWADKHGSAWQTEMYPVPGLPSGMRARGMTAPRLAHDGERFWITYSMNGYAAGAMPGGPAITGKFSDRGTLVEAGGAPTGRSDASLFVDRDGTRYLVWGGGCLAKLKPLAALDALHEYGTGVESPVVYLPATMAGFAGDDGMPERGAPYGASVFHDGRQYRFLFTASTLRGGGVHEDSYICRADNLTGPYSAPEFLVLDSGRCVAFVGADQRWRLSYSDREDRPRIVPLPERPPAAAKTPAKAPASGPVAAALPPRNRAERPSGVPQLLEVVEPCLDKPLRDAALCRGPDGTWFLAGTEATLNGDGSLDWSRNKGVRLWASADRQAWKDLGYVWEIPENEPGHLDVACGAVPRVGRAVTAPELHYLKGTFWIVFSMNGSAIRMLKSASGKAEGPYEYKGTLVAHGRDPSLFEDGGAVHLVWGQGFCAKLNGDLSAVEGPVRSLFTNTDWFFRYHRRPELMGQWGSHLARQGDWYLWTFTTRTGRNGVNAIDTMTAWSKSLDGPWGQPCLTLPNGGQSMLVHDGKNGWLAPVSGEDEYSACVFQPAITPVASGGKLGQPLALAPTGANPAAMPFQAVNSFKSTVLDLWMGFPDLIGTEARDVFLTWDGEQYLAAGTHWGKEYAKRDKMVVARSKDLIHWERFAIYEYPRLKEDGLYQGKELEQFEVQLEKMRNHTKGVPPASVGEGKIRKQGGRYYALFAACGQFPGMPFLVSEGDDVKGPYKAIRNLPFGDFWIDRDGAFFVLTPKPVYARFESLEAFLEATAQEKKIKPGSLKPLIDFQDIPNVCFLEDCEVGLERVGEKYVYWTTDWTGSYDAHYVHADHYGGPWHGTLRVLPFAGNSCLFRDKDGGYWCAYFTNSNSYDVRGQTFCRMNLCPLDAYERDGEFVIEPKALRAQRARLETLGSLWHKPRTGDKPQR